MIIFENEGLLDLRALKIMGVSVKEEGAIGYFGTGLKYALAVLLRTGHKIEIHIDGKLHKIDSVQQDIRGKDFDIIRLDDEELGFTTDLGKNWETWMAFRELACNAKDEGGSFFKATEGNERASITSFESTVITVEGDGIDVAFAKADEIFYQGPATSNTYCDTIRKPSNFIYYRGVKVYKLDKPSKLTYNIKAEMTLTEDRTLADYWQARHNIALHVMLEAKDDDVLTVVRATKKDFEICLDYDQFYTPSESFVKVTGSLVANKKFLNESAREKYVKATDYEAPSVELKLNDVQKQQLEKALAFLKKFEPNIEEYPITVMESIGEGMLGRAKMKSHEIEISKLVFDQGTKQVATTILEEFYHLKHGFRDLTYHFQSFLFDRIISVSEELLGEPL